MAVLGYLAKLERGLGLSFQAHFLHDFSEKCSLFNALSIEKVSMSHLISFSRYQTKCVIKFLFKQFNDIINFKVFLGSTSEAMADREKRGEDEDTKILIS